MIAPCTPYAVFLMLFVIGGCSIEVDGTQPTNTPNAQDDPSDEVVDLLPGDTEGFCDFGDGVISVSDTAVVELSAVLSGEDRRAPEGSATAEGQAIVTACLVRDDASSPPKYYVLAQQSVAAEAALFAEAPEDGYGFYNVGLGIFVKPQDGAETRLRSDISAPRTQEEPDEVGERRTLSIGGGITAGCQGGLMGGTPMVQCKQEVSLKISWSREQYRHAEEEAWSVVRAPQAELSAQEAGWHWFQNAGYFYDGSLPAEARAETCADKAFTRDGFQTQYLPNMAKQLDVNALAVWEVERPANGQLTFDIRVFQDLDLAYGRVIKKCEGRRVEETATLTLDFQPFDDDAL